jgi:hypothetical protein
MSYDPHDLPAERVYKSLWHVALACIGLYELNTHKTKVAKVLATGMIAFHVDAAVADAFDQKPLSRRILERVTGVSDEPAVLRRDERPPTKKSRRTIR